MSKILVSGGLVPTTKDTLLDARTRVATFSDIANIENPARFMVITVEDTGKKYEVKKLSSKIIGGIVVENSTIDINDPEALVDLGLAEELRSEEEKVRQSNEKKRIEAENLRKSAEDSRNVNETNRVSAEGVREASERTRVSSEETRNANEQTRNSNETKRQFQESTRQSQESARQNNESTRNTNESARKEAESKRKTEETSRRTAELSRSSAENERVKNEQNRTTAENTRSSAEDRRVVNETQRTTNETARSNAELSREQAEGNRASTFNTLKGQMQTTIQEGQTAVAATEKATSDAQKVVDNYDAKVAEQDSKLTELGQYVDAINIEDSERDTLYVCDQNGNVIAIINKNGIKTTKYSSPQFSIEDNGKRDFVICDENGNVVFKLDKNTNTYTMVKDKIVGIKNVPAISWIDDDFAIFNNSGEVLGIYQDIHDWCIDRNIRFDFALTPSEQKIEKAQEYEEEGFTFLLHPTHNGWYDYADGTVHDITKARKSLISCIRFFRKNLVSKANILVYPGSSDTYADNVAFISQYVECAIRATMEGSNQAAKNDKYKLTRLSLILDNVKTKTKTKELIRKYLENGDWVILYTHLYSWEVSDVVDETSLSSANLKEMIEYANSICPLKSTESIWEERKVMFNI